MKKITCYDDMLQHSPIQHNMLLANRIQRNMLHNNPTHLPPSRDQPCMKSSFYPDNHTPLLLTKNSSRARNSEQSHCRTNFPLHNYQQFDILTLSQPAIPSTQTSISLQHPPRPKSDLRPQLPHSRIETQVQLSTVPSTHGFSSPN